MISGASKELQSVKLGEVRFNKLLVKVVKNLTESLIHLVD